MMKEEEEEEEEEERVGQLVRVLEKVFSKHLLSKLVN